MPETLTAHERTLLSALEMAKRWMRPDAPWTVAVEVEKALTASYAMQDAGRIALSHPTDTVEDEPHA